MQILSTVDLLSVIPADAELKSVGRDRWRGRCPIGNHAVGGFSVTRHKDGHLIYQCFACHARGSVIDMYAALNGVSIKEAIRQMARKEKAVTREFVLQRSYDNWMLTYPGFAYLFCDDCGAMEKIETELDFVILCGLGSWLWDVCRDGSARCIKCRRIN